MACKPLLIQDMSADYFTARDICNGYLDMLQSGDRSFSTGIKIRNKYLDMFHSGDRKYGTGIELQEETKVSKGILRPVSDLKWLPCLIIARIIYGPLPTSLLNELLVLHKLRENVFTQVMTGGISRFWISRYLPLPTNWLLWVRIVHL